MSLNTRPYWLTLATTTDLAVSGVCLEPWQAAPLMGLIKNHHEGLGKSEPLISGWSLRHVREPVITAWKLCEKFGSASASELNQLAYSIDMAAKSAAEPHAWQWSHVERDRRTTCATPFSGCILARAEDMSLMCEFATKVAALMANRNKEAPDFAYSAALLIREQEMDFLDPLSAIERLRERIAAPARAPLDFARLDELQASVEKWLLVHSTSSAPAVCDPVRI